MDWKSWDMGFVFSFAANYLIVGSWDITSLTCKIKKLIFISLGVFSFNNQRQKFKTSFTLNVTSSVTQFL